MTATPRPLPSREPTATALERTAGTITVTVVYDNNAYRPGLQTAWGFGCVVEAPSGTVLFDTGGDGSILLSNMAKLGVDISAIDAVVLSHIHGDHVNGLQALLGSGIAPPVYAPAAFPAAFKAQTRARTELIEVTGPIDVLPGVGTTGEIGTHIVEQALVVESAYGLVVITGCAHPGVATMVSRAVEASRSRVALVLGGFHLSGSSRGEIEAVAASLRALGVHQVAPCHCSGDLARQVFSEMYGGDCHLPGVGWTITLPAAGG